MCVNESKQQRKTTLWICFIGSMPYAVCVDKRHMCDTQNNAVFVSVFGSLQQANLNLPCAHVFIQISNWSRWFILRSRDCPVNINIRGENLIESVNKISHRSVELRHNILYTVIMLLPSYSTDCLLFFVISAYTVYIAAHQLLKMDSI